MLAVHDAQLAEHGGAPGVRNAGLFASALARPRNLEAYGNAPDLPRLAAAYGYGLARNHPFVDGNKRTALVAMELFLALNSLRLTATDGICVPTILQLADGSLSEAGLAEWVRANSEHVTP